MTRIFKENKKHPNVVKAFFSFWGFTEADTLLFILMDSEKLFLLAIKHCMSAAEINNRT